MTKKHEKHEKLPRRQELNVNSIFKVASVKYTLSNKLQQLLSYLNRVENRFDHDTSECLCQSQGHLTNL